MNAHKRLDILSPQPCSLLNQVNLSNEERERKRREEKTLNGREMKEKCHIFSLVTQLFDEIVDIPSSFLSANHLYSALDSTIAIAMTKVIHFWHQQFTCLNLKKKEKNVEVLMQRENN